MIAVLRLSGSYPLRISCCRADRKMKIKDPSSREAVALQPVPAADGNGGNSKVVRNGLDTVILSDAIHSQALGVRLRITATFRRDGDHQFGPRFNAVRGRKL